MGQNAEVMPRPPNLSTVIHSLKVRIIFSLLVLKKHMLDFAQIISVFRKNHVESFKCDMIYEPCHGEACLCQYVAWVSRV